MARLTWENVAAPNFSGVGDSLRTAASLMSNATSGFAGALGDFQKASERDAGNQLMQRALGMTDRDQLNAALQSGTMFAGINGADRGALEFLANRDAALLRNQGAMLDNRNTGYNYDRAVIDNQRADTRYNTAPEAMNIITQARQLATGGDNAAAQRLLNENSKVLADAGISPERALTMDFQNREASTYTMDFNQALEKYNKWQEGVGREADTSTRADYIANNSANRAQALDIVSKLPNLSVKDRVAIQERIGALGDNFWPQVSEQQQRAAVLGLQPNDLNRRIAGNAPNPGGQSQNAGNVPGNNPTNAPAVGRGGLRSPVGGSTENMITYYARMYGIDPSVALKVAKSEGGLSDHVQSDVRKNGRREPSYGPFQLLVGGGNTGFPEGLGNSFIKDTGLDPSDPANKEATIAYALREASQNGWGKWYGAKNVGIGNRDGIGGNGSKDLPAFDRGGATGVAGPASGGTQQPTASSVLAQNASDAPQYETSTRAESASRTPAEDLLSSSASSAPNAETPQAQSQANSGGSDTTTATTEAQTVAGAEANTGVNQTVPPGGIPGSIDQVMNMPQGGAPVTAPVTSDPDAGRQMLGASASPIGGNSPAGALNRSNTGTVLPGYDIPNRIAADAMFDQDAVLRNAINNLKNEPPVSQVDVANALIEGKFKGANANEIRNQVAELTKMTNGDPRIAGLLMEMNDQGGQGLWDGIWGVTQRVNMDAARAKAKTLDFNPETGEVGAVNMLNAASASNNAQTTSAEARSYLAQARAEYAQALATRDPQLIAEALQNLQEAIAIVNANDQSMVSNKNRLTNFPSTYGNMGPDGRPVERKSAASQRTPAERSTPPAAIPRAGAYAGYDAESLANAQRLLLQR